MADTVQFIAPNGAKVTVTAWQQKAVGPTSWPNELMLQIIFNDPLLTN
jgi:hypothetical protein